MATTMDPATETTEEPGLLTGRYRLPTIALVTTVTLLAFDGMAVGTVMPVVAKDLGDLPLYAWGFTAMLIAGLFANVVAGGWTDARGPAKPMLTGLVLFVAGLLIAAVAPTMVWFVAGRAVQGLGAGATVVATYVFIARVYPESLRPRVFATSAAAWVVPSLIGPAVAGLVAEHLSWRLVFLALITLVVPAAIMLLPALRDCGGGTGSFAWGPSLAAVGAAGGTALLLYGCDHRSVLPAAVGTAGLAAGLPRLLPTGTFRLRRGLPTAVILRMVFAVGFFGTEAFIPLGLTRLHGFTPTEAGIVLTVGALGWSGAAWVQGRSTRDRTSFIILGAVLLAAGATASALTLSLPGPAAAWVAGPAWIVAGAGMGFGLASISVQVLKESDPAEQGTNSSALQISDTLGSSLSVGLAGSLVTAFPQLSTGLRAAGALTAFIAAAGIAAAFRVESPR